MSRIHDMGGRFGDTAIPDKDDSVVFHSRWEARVLATTLATGYLGGWNIDAGRHAREALLPRDYACFGYYEKWLAALADLLVERNFLTKADLVRGRDLASGEATPATPAPLAKKAIRAPEVGPAQHKIVPYRRTDGPAAKFRPGDRVMTADYNPNWRKSGGHTRLPAYAMGRVGTILMRHGNFVLPDSNAHFMGESPEPLYAVEFPATTLWHGDAEDGADSMICDLWQSYLTMAPT